MKVTIITVCRNSESTIEKTIQSVLSQTYQNLEYIIVDGASQDKTLDIINSYHHRISLIISETDNGIYEAMNKGIRRASGVFLYFLNADDYLINETVIEGVVQFIQQHSQCDLVYGNHQARHLTGDTGIYEPVMPDQMLSELVCLGDRQLLQPASFFRADVFNQVGFFNETYKIAADYDWFLRFVQQPHLKFCYIPRTIVSYAHGGASGNIRALFEELFEIQNQSPICQQPEWLIKRLNKLQAMFVDKYELLESTNKLSIARLHHIETVEARLAEELAVAKTRKAQKNAELATEIETLQARIASLEAEIAAMKTSKFWKMRSAWFKFKQAIGLPTDE